MPIINTALLRSLFLIAIASLTLSCKTRRDPTHKEDMILIGEVSSMSGEEATYGISAHRGISLAIQEFNEKGGLDGKMIKLISIDSQGKPDESARAITKLIATDKVAAVITGVISSNALAMVPIAQENKIPLIATISTHPNVTKQGDYIFRVCLMDSFQGKVMAKFALDHLKAKRVAILRDIKSDYSLALTDAFLETFRREGGEVILLQTYSAGDIDFKSQLTAIRAKRPDALYLPGYYTDVSLIARQAKELGMTMPFLGGDGWDSPKLTEIGGEALDGSYFSASYSSEIFSPQLDSFTTHYKKAYGAKPDGLALNGYEGAEILLAALKKQTNVNSESIKHSLRSIPNFRVASGVVTFDSDRNMNRAGYVLKIEKNGHYKQKAVIF